MVALSEAAATKRKSHLLFIIKSVGHALKTESHQNAEWHAEGGLQRTKFLDSLVLI
ncbi:MAG: hypothetical protein ACLT1K_11955 [[Clostridium] leptum]